MKLIQAEIEMTPDQLAVIAQLRKTAISEIGPFYAVAEPKPNTTLMRITIIPAPVGQRIQKAVNDYKSRGPRGARKNCKCCHGTGYIVGPSGSHDCDCTREV